MRTAEETSAINRMLQSHGLGTLQDGAGLMSQLGFMVMDHEHLRSLLVRCEPENRSAMYDSLKPYLRFTPKPLDVYIAESAERAANQGLPTIDETGNIHFSPTPTYEMGDVAVALDVGPWNEHDDYVWRMLSPKRDLTAAKLFLRLALSGTVVPDSYRGLFTITCQRIAQSILERTEPGLVVPPLEEPVAEDRLANLL